LTSAGIDASERKTLLEIGCGVGNFVFPLIEESSGNLFIYACDFSARAVQIVRNHPLYNESKVYSECILWSASLPKCPLVIIRMLAIANFT
jgi:methyltransferase-like protein 6